MSLLFQSDVNYLKIHDEGKLEFSLSASGTSSQVVSHSLGYVPFVKFYVKNDAGKIKNSYTGADSRGFGNTAWIRFDYIVTVSNIEVSAFNTDSSNPRSSTAYYRIYNDRVAG